MIDAALNDWWKEMSSAASQLASTRGTSITRLPGEGIPWSVLLLP